MLRNSKTDKENRLSRSLRRASGVRKDTDGSATVMGLFAFMMGMMVLGVALDRANGWRVRTQMQVATDAAALAAATQLDDVDAALALALDTANRNLSGPNEVGAEDVVFGSLDPDTLEFVAQSDEDGAYTAVTVVAGRTAERGNEVGTYLLNVVGINSLDINVGSIALATGGDGEPGSTCQDALFLSTATVGTGGSNDFDGAICIHGEQGVLTGGGDRYNEFVRFTSASLADVTLNSYSPSTIEREDLMAARSMTPMLLPVLDDMRTGIWDDLWLSRSENPSLWVQPIAPWGSPYHYYVGEYEIQQSDYTGIIPAFVFDSSGTARVEMHEDYWTVENDALEPHTIYLSSTSMQFAGGVDIENAAFISQANIGVGGGAALHFDDVYFIGTNVNMAGSITWGDPVNPCDVDYGVYIFGTSSLSLGGWYSGASVSGMVGAAPRFDPGGAMQGTGVYFETDSALSMGGNYDLYGCTEPKHSQFPILDAGVRGAIVSAGSALFR